MTKADFDKEAKRQGFEYAEFLIEHEGIKYYSCEVNTFQYTGYPIFMYEKDNKIKIVSDDKAMELLDLLPDNEDDE